MVLGLSTKGRAGPTVKVDYLIHIEEIKPWPPSQSLRSLSSVLIQWENGERNSGSTNTVVPSIGSVVGEGKIEFNESFKLPVALVKELSVKGRDGDAFQKNLLEFNLHERRRDKNQLLATAVVDLADYGILKESLRTSVSMNCKRTFNNTSQPVLFIKIQPFDNGRAGSSKGRLSKGISLDKNGSESASDLMNGEYGEESEFTSFTDDDVSSHSSLTVSSSALESNGVLPSQSDENGSATVMDGKGGVKKEHASASKSQLEKSNMGAQMAVHENAKGSSSCSSSVDCSSDLESPVDGHFSISNSHDSKLPISNNALSSNDHFPASSLARENTDEETKTSMRSNGSKNLTKEVHKMVSNDGAEVTSYSKENATGSFQVKEAPSVNSPHVSQKLGVYNSMGNIDGSNLQENDCAEDELSTTYSQDSLSLGQENNGTKVNTLKTERSKHVKSVRSSSDSARSMGLFSNSQHAEVKEDGLLRGNERKDAKLHAKDTRGSILDNKIQQLEQKTKMLEGELREAAAIEAALYSVVAEHGSSVSKMHAPARRLSRLYLYSCRERLRSRKASSARSSVSGLVLVAKACGNDVPRLTFWLSNSVVLRAIVSQSTGESGLPPSAGPVQKNAGGKGKKQASSPLKWKDSFSSYRKENKNLLYESFGDWDDPRTFISALERIEAWIFCRIIESVWWQTLTPHMQSAARKLTDKGTAFDSRKKYGRISSSCNQDQVNFSLDHWKKAFKDACERLCPVRAEGHECGCLPVLARLIMEQCVARLDVAMFNAILRESDDEIPTDPVSDPISDSMVLPIPAGKTSFGAGAQLKNAIGSWSRWLTDLFGIDDDDTPEDDNCDSDEREDSSFKSFYLLNALSDLMMLPKDMLLSTSIRKEVCPTFGASLIKRVLDNFVPDDFCPDPVPDALLEALDEEDPDEVNEGSVTSFPCAAAPPLYSPPSAASVTSIIGEARARPQLRKSGSSVLRKSYTSDDELDELSSPLASIFNDGMRSESVSSKPSWISRGNENQNGIRYELLRDVWTKSE
ncbi:hypothetical protein SLA2020_173210 [Shorea laevis]